MKRRPLFIVMYLSIASLISSEPNSFLASLRQAGTENSGHFIVSLFEVTSDVDLIETELEMEINVEDNQDVSARVQGDTLRILLGDRILKQYRVSIGLKVSEIGSPTPETKNPELKQLEKYAPTAHDWGIGMAISSGSDLVQLSSDMFLVVDSDNIVWTLRKTSLGYSTNVTDLRVPRNHRLSFVQYLPGKVAYVDDFGRVRRFLFGQRDYPIPIYAVSKRLLETISSRNVADTCAILSDQLLPNDRIDQAGYATCLDRLIDTRDSNFILACLEVLSRSMEIPFKKYTWQENPLVRIAANGDVATAAPVLDEWPELANEATKSDERNTTPITPIEIAVANGHVEMVKLLIKAGAEFQRNNRPDSLYSKAKSEEMRKYLEELGFVAIIEYSASGLCNDNNVEIRKDHSNSSEILGLLQQNDKVEILAVTARKYSVDGYREDVWYRVHFKDVVGWVFGYFLWDEGQHSGGRSDRLSRGKSGSAFE